MERQLRMGGGIMDVQPRQGYFLGKIAKAVGKGVKGVAKGVGSFLKSDAGKLALLAAPFIKFPGMESSLFNKIGGGGGIMDFFTSGSKAAQMLKVGGAGSALAAVLAGEEGEGESKPIAGRDIPSLKAKLTKAYELQRTFKDSPDEASAIAAQVENDVNEYISGAGGYAEGGRIGYANGSEDYEDRFMKLVAELREAGFSQQEAIEEARERLSKDMAEGGRIGFDQGTPEDFRRYLEEREMIEKMMKRNQLMKEYEEDIRRKKVMEQKQMVADGGRIGYAFGDSAEDNAIQASGVMGLPLNRNPAGITELDLRETGGFIPPVGVKEKADDIPAMLSNNEFVFTADAVRGMGDGDVNKGAQRMYDMMKKLENGGRV